MSLGSNPTFYTTLKLMMMYHQTKFGCKRIYRSEDIVGTAIFWSYEPMLVIDVSTPFCMTLRFVMMHHHTTFGYKRSSGPEDTGRTVTDIWNLRCDLALEHSNPIFLHSTLAYDDVSTNQVWLQGSGRSSEDTVETVIFWLYNASLWPRLWSGHTDLPGGHVDSWWRTTKPSLITEGWAVQEISSGQNPDTRTDGHSEPNTPPAPHFNFVTGWGVGGGGRVLKWLDHLNCACWWSR